VFVFVIFFFLFFFFFFLIFFFFFKNFFFFNFFFFFLTFISISHVRWSNQFPNIIPRLLGQASISDGVSFHPSHFWKLRDKRNLQKKKEIAIFSWKPRAMLAYCNVVLCYLLTGPLTESAPLHPFIIVSCTFFGRSSSSAWQCINT